MSRPTLLYYCFLTSCIISIVAATATLQDVAKKDNPHKGNVLIDGTTPKDKVIKFPYYISGHDYDDQPVIVMEWGRWDIRTLSEIGGQEMEDFETSADYFVDLVKTGYFTNKYNISETDSQTTGIVGLIDFDGLNLRQIGSADSMKLLLRTFAKLERCHGQFAYGFIVNANPLVHQVIHLSSPFMGKFLERTEVHGTNSRKWIPELLKKIPRNQLHPVYGGPKDFRPLAVYSLI